MGYGGKVRQWDWGTPNQIRAEVHGRIQKLVPEGLLLALAYDIDYASFDNIVAFVDAKEDMLVCRKLNLEEPV